MIAAIARWPIWSHSDPITATLTSYIFLIILVAYDLWSTRKVHRATIWAGVCAGDGRRARRAEPGVVPGMTEPKFERVVVDRDEITGWRSTPTVPPPCVPPPPPPPPPDEEHAAVAADELCGFGVPVAEVGGVVVGVGAARSRRARARWSTLSAGAGALPSNSVAEPQPTRSSTPEPRVDDLNLAAR